MIKIRTLITKRRVEIALFALSVILSLSFSVQASAEPISIMAFNVENLFDAKDDPRKSDETYLPANKKKAKAHITKCEQITVRRWREQCLYWDWNEVVVEKKLRAVSDAIKQVNDGVGPDIIALQEVENVGILERLRSDFLAGLGYQPAVLKEGNDKRGIDVAFLSKFPTIGAQLHPIEFTRSSRERIDDTRPILQASFKLPNGATLTGFSVHFPAPYHPTKMREAAYKTLNALVAVLPQDQAVFAAGDFNTTREENIKRRMLARWVRPAWEVAHDLCQGCAGTSYYPPKNDWSFLDMVLWRAMPGWKVTKSFIANKTPEQVLPDGTPKRFQLPAASGVSDHWPLVMVVEKSP